MDVLSSLRSYFKIQAVAPLNIPAASVTAAVFQAEMSWLKASAYANICFHRRHRRRVPSRDVLVEGCGAIEHVLHVVTAAVFQAETGALLKAMAPLNMDSMVVTAAVFQAEMSWLKAAAS